MEFSTLSWDLYASIVLAVLLLGNVRSGNELDLTRKLFLGLLLSNLLVLLVEMGTRLVNGLDASWAVSANHGLNLLLFAANLLPGSFWILYVTYQVSRDRDAVVRAVHVLVALQLTHLVLVVLTPFTGILFTILPDNLYERGPGYAVTAGLNFLLVGYSFVYTALHRKRLTRKQFVAMLLFPFFPAAGAVVQVIAYDLTLIWGTMALSVLLIYVNVQHELVNTDFLTGLANRRHLDEHLRRRIAERSRRGRFALLMIDLDDFKAINDVHGHREGDVALETTAKVISSALRSDDFVARYAGDEFVVVLGIEEPEPLERAVARIRAALERHNEQSEKPYTLSFSVGAGIYDPDAHGSVDRFLHDVDERMYEQKRERQAEG